jgi:dTDP-glucose pyrophosphorylase
MKALILAGGRGRRLEAHSADCNKCMIEFAGRPLIEWSLDNCFRTGAEEIVVVVGYLAEQIINHYGNSYRGIRIRYAIQREQRGLVHAIETAAPFLGASNFMLMLADEILLDPNHAAMVQRFERGDVFALCGLTIAPDPEAVRKTYAVFEDRTGRILRLVEKPRHAVNQYQGTGNCIFSNRILEYIEHTPINQARNEKELPDLIQCAIDDGHAVESFLVGGRYVNINTAEDVALAEDAICSGAGAPLFGEQRRM